MGLPSMVKKSFTALRNWRLNLTEQDRTTLWQMVGSFRANMFATNGKALLENSYEKNVDVYSIITKIINIQKSVPWIVEKRKGEGWVEVKDTTIHDLMRSPNIGKGYSWDDIEEQMLVFLLATGNVFIHGTTQFNSSLIEEIDILPTNHTCIEATDDFFMPDIKYKFEIGKTRRVFTNEQIAHIRMFNPGYSSVRESLMGLSPVAVASSVIQTGNDRWDAHANLLQNRGVSGMITDKSAKPMTAEEARTAQDLFDRDTTGPANFGRIKVTNKDLAFIQMAMSAEDLKIIESGVLSLRALCNVYGIDSSVLNDPENKTYNNRSEAEKALYSGAIIPLSERIAEKLTAFIVRNHYPGKDMRMRQDFSGIECLKENFNEKAKTYTELKKSGIYTANEVRGKLGDERINDPEADKLSTVQGNKMPNDLQN